MALQRTGMWGLLGYLFCMVLVGCSNGSGRVEDGSGGSAPPPTGSAQGGDSSYTISVTVSGLAGTGLVLQNNGANDIPVAANGKLTFGEPIASGGAYNVTVLSQPTNPTQTCTVVGGSGTVANADVTNISVNCSTPDAQSFAIRGTVSGLTGSGLVLQNEGGDTLSIAADGQFSFATPLATGSTYTVTVLTQPSNPTQTCSVNNNHGTVGTQDVTNVSVTCSDAAHPVQISVSGLRGFGLQLQLNGVEVLPISGDGSYAFTQPVARGAAYSVRVSSDPTNPKQTCVVNQPSGIMGDAPVTLTVTCSDDQSIGGEVTGLAGSGFVLRLTAGSVPPSNLAVASSGSFQFSTVLPRGTQYTVDIATQPSNPTQQCVVQNASGVVGSAPVSNIGVTCTTAKFKITVNVAGLQGSGLELRNEWSGTHEDIQIAGNGSVDFPTQLDSGTAYTVSVHKRPNKPRQECRIDNPQGTIGAGNVALNVTCDPPTEFVIAGSISGLEGQGLQLQNNGTDTLSVSPGATGFEFAGLITAQTGYTVTVAAQPSSPTQSCVVANGAGTVNNADVNNVSIACTTQPFKIGGSVTGLGLFNFAVQLQLNGSETTTVLAGSPAFMFTTPVLSGTPYNVTVAVQPAGATCAVLNGIGTMGGADITDIAVSCN